MATLASICWSFAVLSLAGAGLTTLVGWAAGASACARASVTLVVVGCAATMPWSRWISESTSAFRIEESTSFLVLAGHVALVGWLLVRRYSPRFLDERARGRARRPFERNRGSR